MRHLTPLAVAGLIAVTGCSVESPTSVDTSEPAAKKTVKMVPYKGTIIGSVVPAGPPSPATNCVPRRLTVSGQASHLGNFTAVGTHCFLLSDVIAWSQPGDIINMDRGEMSWVSANGDEFHGTYVGRAALDVLDLVTGIAEGPVEMEFEITGGIGRFENATGGGGGSGLAQAGEQGLTMTFEGLISSVGSSR